ncbi:hypothetical protein [Streptomyces flaveolus]|uniref:hypothetical protein n=1 Tax=Streptomyces flaveolus TaxID=67297 RepID=UPI0036F4CD07
MPRRPAHVAMAGIPVVSHDDDPADLYDIGAYAARALAESRKRPVLSRRPARLRAETRAEGGTRRAADLVEEALT